MSGGFAEALRKLRDESGLSLSALARRANCSKSEVGHAETGFRLPSEPVVLGLDQALEADGLLVALADTDRLRQRRSRTAKRSAQVNLGETVLLRLRIDGREVVMSLDRRALLRSGVGSLVAAFSLDHHTAVLTERLTTSTAGDMVFDSPVPMGDVLARLRDQWHELVKTDNLLGPHTAIAGVRNQLSIVDGLLTTARGTTRTEVVRLGAQYAESIAWLYEDLGDVTQARWWTSLAAEWAYEANDRNMLAWTMFRRSQQAGADRDGGQVLGLTQAVRREEDQLPTPMRAALRVQQAYGHALDGDADAAQHLLDEAHTWATTDTAGDARGGHGSFCTPSYIEINRANCLLTARKTQRAVELYERSVPTVPEVYLRDRAAASGRMAAAYAANGDIEQAARTALALLPIARSTGSVRILREIEGVAACLEPHRTVHAVAEMLEAVAHREE